MHHTSLITRRALWLAGSALPLNACAFSLGGLLAVTGSGRITTWAPELPAFTALDVADALAVEIEQGQPPRVLVEGDDNLLPLLDLQVHDGTLSLRQQRAFKPTRLRIVVTVWQLDSLAVAGSAAVRAGTLVAKTLQLSGGGSGVISLGALTAERVSVQAGGSAAVKLAGQANALTLAVGGSAAVDAAALQARRVDASAGGSAAAKVWATDTLSGGVAGAALLRYRGSPQLTLSTSGAGQVGKI